MWPRPGAPAPRMLPPLETLVLVLSDLGARATVNRGCCGLALTSCPPEATSWSHRAAGGRRPHGGRLCVARGGAGPGTCCFLFNFSTCVRGLPWCVTARDAGCRRLSERPRVPCCRVATAPRSVSRGQGFGCPRSAFASGLCPGTWLSPCHSRLPPRGAGAAGPRPGPGVGAPVVPPGDTGLAPARSAPNHPIMDQNLAHGRSWRPGRPGPQPRAGTVPL